MGISKSIIGPDDIFSEGTLKQPCVKAVTCYSLVLWEPASTD